MVSATVAFCTYNRSDKLHNLVRALRRQESPIPFEILAVDNNSVDDTAAVLGELACEKGVPLRVVRESKQGIVPARNRAIEETLSRDYILFLDDDELPEPGFVVAALDALMREGAECVGGRIRVQLGLLQRPGWLEDDLMIHLGQADYGDTPFWIQSAKTPVWTGNSGFLTALFRNGLRFDHRFNREGRGIEGGEDEAMFQILLGQGARIRHRPDMVIQHFVEDWRIRRSYFLRLSYGLGRRAGFWADVGSFERELFGVPSFLLAQMVSRCIGAVRLYAGRRPGAFRKAMSAMHAVGMIEGRFRRRHGGWGGESC